MTNEEYRFLQLFGSEQDLRTLAMWSRGVPAVKLRQMADAFIKAGYLQEAPLEEIATRFLTAAELKTLAAKHGKSSGGTKFEIVMRLADEPNVLRAALRGRQVLRLTTDGLAAMEETERAQEAALRRAVLASYDAFGSGDFANGRRVISEFTKSVGNVRNRHYISGGFYGDELVEPAIAASPPSLAGDPQLLFEARAILGMDSFWDEIDWRGMVADRMASPGERLEQAKNHLLRCAYYRTEISDGRTRENGTLLCSVTFVTHDVKSCHLCRELQLSNRTVEAFPDLPLKGCSSAEGCQFELSVEPLDIDDHVDSVEVPDRTELAGLTYRERQKALVPERLQRLKELLQMELITQDDYDAKKRDILEDL